MWTGCGEPARELWRKLWTRTWTKALVAGLVGADDAPLASRRGRGGRGETGAGGDRLHRVLLRAQRGGLAGLVRRDVPRSQQEAVSGAWLRGADGGGHRFHAGPT